jgi:peptidoglycan hydrolase CwlO-like protein
MNWIWFILFSALVVIIVRQYNIIYSLKHKIRVDAKKYRELEIERDNLWRKLDSIENPYEKIEKQIKEDKKTDQDLRDNEDYSDL